MALYPRSVSLSGFSSFEIGYRLDDPQSKRPKSDKQDEALSGMPAVLDDLQMASNLEKALKSCVRLHVLARAIIDCNPTLHHGGEHLELSGPSYQIRNRQAGFGSSYKNPQIIRERSQ